jgi:hypothetical protein
MTQKMNNTLTGMAVGLDQLAGLKFDPRSPHVYCGICGDVYQLDLNRNPHKYVSPAFDNNFVLVEQYGVTKLKEWSQTHAREHTSNQHRLLALSNESVTPEAAHKLAAFGIIPITQNPDIVAALYESSPVPIDDAEGS